MTKIDWQQVEQWNNAYIVKCFLKHSEYGTMFVESTEGDYLIDSEGKRWLDFKNQLYCVNAGQRVPEIQQAIKDACDRYGFVWDIYTTDYKAEAAKILIQDILGPKGWAGQVRFTLGGGDSVEVASLIARLLTGKHLIATREFGYHGVSSGAVSFTRIIASRNNAVDEVYEKQSHEIPGADYNGSFMVPAPNCYRCALGHTHPECKCVYADGTLPCVKQTELIIRSHGVQRTAAIITEPAQGAGTIMPPEEYLGQIYEMKNRLGILWIVDEVLMGFGRLGAWFGHQTYGNVEPDIMTCAKGLSSSSLPMGAVVISKELAKQMGELRWNHVSTFSGHPIAMAAAVANMKYMLKNDTPEHCKKAGEYFGAELRALAEKHRSIGFIGGKGMFWQVELVKNRETKEPFVADDRYITFAGDQSKYPIHMIAEKCAEKGVILGGFLPNTLRIGASCMVEKADMDKAIDAMDAGLTYLETQF